MRKTDSKKLYVAKIQKKGALSILGVIADFICASADFRSFKKNLLAYCVMALAPMMAVMPAQFDAFMKNKGDFASFEGVIVRLLRGEE